VAEDLSPVYLLAGTDRPKIRRALTRLRARFGSESSEHLSAESAGGAEAVAACNAVGLFAGADGWLVVVEDVERWLEDDLQALAAYLEEPAPGAVLALVAEEPPRDAALARLVAERGEVLAFDVPKPRDPSVWVRAEFSRLETRVEDEAARKLVEIVGDDVTTLGAEVEKIALWAAGEPVGVREVELLAVPGGEAEPWALTDAWGARDLAAATSACELALLEKEPFVLALALASHVRRVRAAQALAEEGLGAREIAKRLRMKEFPARKALAQAQNYSRDELDDAIVRLAALDAAVKGASRLAAELELERALTDVVRGHEPAAGAAG
jgi:DNA polymerase-3 subunit delta